MGDPYLLFGATVEREPRVRTPLGAFAVIFVAPLAFLLLMVPGLLAGGVVPSHLRPGHVLAPPVENFFNPGGVTLPDGPVVSNPPALNPAPVVVPAPAPSLSRPAQVVSPSISVPNPVVTQTPQPPAASSKHNNGKHKGEGQNDTNHGAEN